MIIAKHHIHYIVCIVSHKLTMGNSFAKANTATRETDLLTEDGGGACLNKNIHTCEI